MCFYQRIKSINFCLMLLARTVYLFLHGLSCGATTEKKSKSEDVDN